LWFRNGLAEVLSNSIVRDSEIQFGRSIPWNVASLQNDARLRLAELITLDSSSSYYTSGVTRARFDAQCWGVMHYMLFGQVDQRDRVNQLATLLLKGTSSADAIQQVFGSVDALETAYLQYQKRSITNYARLKVETNASSKSFPIRALGAADSAAVRAALHAAFGRPVEARAMIAAAGPQSAAGYDVEAILLEREGKRDEARSAYAKAVESKSQSFYTLYRLASLTWGEQPNAETLSRVETLARQSIALNSFYAPAQALLADAVARGPMPADALGPAIRASTLDPTSSNVRLSLARVLWQMSRRGEAMGHARAARALARTDQQRAQADELIAFFGRVQTK
jgi:tetratricopeptide (TPR) repeat protein